MPTENRSSNTEMVSDLLPCPFCGEKPQITKHHREDIYSFMHRCPVLGPISWGFREDPQAHVEKWNARAQPAQHQGEPVALPGRKSYEESFSVHGQGQIMGWNAYHDEIAKLGPLYTHPAPADPGEVERLRLLLGQARSMVNGATDEWHKSVAEVLKND